MRVTLKNHSYKYDIENTIRIFHKGELLFNEEYSEDYLISQLIDGFAQCELFIKGKLFKESAIVTHPDDEKRLLKITTYRCLSEYYQEQSPYGILVGIRPVKLIHEKLDLGDDIPAIETSLEKKYLISEEKVKLLIKTAQNERKAVFPIDHNSIGLYISVPFCKSRCYYCSFPAYDATKYAHLMDDYLEAVKIEMAIVMECYAKMTGFVTDLVYVGGGTPTALDGKRLDVLLKTVNQNIDLSKIEEYTVEAGRPDTLDSDKLDVIKNNHADRICLNPQTMNDATLQRIGRKHTSEEIKSMYRLIEKYDFKAVNMDMIAGLTGESLLDFKSSLDQVIDLDPENITVHTLSVKRASMLKEGMDRFQITSDSEVEQMVRYAYETLSDHNYDPYYLYRQKNISANLENIGYTHPGFESKYNIKIMEERNTFLGFGVGAASKIFKGDNRFEPFHNPKSIEEYIRRVETFAHKKCDIIRL